MGVGNMIQWENATASYSPNVDLIPILNEFGERGWEVSSIIHRSGLIGSSVLVYFKRIKREN